MPYLTITALTDQVVRKFLFENLMQVKIIPFTA